MYPGEIRARECHVGDLATIDLPLVSLDTDEIGTDTTPCA